MATKKKGNKKSGDKPEEKKDIPPPPKLNFNEEEISAMKVNFKYHNMLNYK